MTRKTSAQRALTDSREAFGGALLAWYRVNQRDLPWRRSPSLYKTVVSEFMLQQTQVKTVLPYFDRWMKAFPSFALLAAASQSEVIRQWEGLGYYSRARNLHRLAKAVAKREGYPDSSAAWMELPGVGPYTAAAIASIALGEAVACVDGNVVRILSRLTATGSLFKDSASASKAFTALADELVPKAMPGDHNQAMMELGATVCTRHGPACPDCPVSGFCRARIKGNPEAYPRLVKKKMERRSVVRLWCERDGSLLLHRSPAGSRRLADLHELPHPEHLGLQPERVICGELLGRKTRSITRFTITEAIYRSRAPRSVARNLRWVRIEDLGGIALSGPHRRWVTQILKARSSSAGSSH